MSIFQIFSLSLTYSLEQLGKKVDSKYLVLAEEVLKSKSKSTEIQRTKSSLKRNRKLHKL